MTNTDGGKSSEENDFILASVYKDVTPNAKKCIVQNYSNTDA